MRTTKFLLASALLVAASASAVMMPADAADGIYVPLFTYRTGPYAGSGIPIANGMADYLNMLNERDGGIGGVKLIVEPAGLARLGQIGKQKLRVWPFPY